jgi:hypothetical protein
MNPPMTPRPTKMKTTVKSFPSAVVGAGSPKPTVVSVVTLK